MTASFKVEAQHHRQPRARPCPRVERGDGPGPAVFSYTPRPALTGLALNRGGRVLHGRVRLTSPDTSWDGRLGDHLVIPSTRHGLRAVDDCVVLLTVAKSVER